MKTKKKADRQKTWIGIVLVLLVLSIFAPQYLSPKAKWQRQMDQVKTLHQQGKRAEAVPLAQRVITSAEKLYGKNSLQVQQARELLLEIYRYEKEAAPMKLLASDIEKGYREERAKLEETMGPDHPQTIYVLVKLAQLYHGQRRYEESEGLYLEALNRIEENDPNRVMIWYQMINLYNSQKKFDQSGDLYGKILAYYEGKYGSENIALKDPLRRMAEFYRERGNEARAKEAEGRIAALHPGDQN